MAGFLSVSLAATGSLIILILENRYSDYRRPSGKRHETWHLQQHPQASGAEVMRFAALFEKTNNGWSAYAPDLPGLGVAASTIEETKQLLREAIELHLDDLRATGQPIPAAASQADYVEVPRPA
jgi:predicted RNase H-like HicB family nuclease